MATHIHKCDNCTHIDDPNICGGCFSYNKYDPMSPSLAAAVASVEVAEAINEGINNVMKGCVQIDYEAEYNRAQLAIHNHVEEIRRLEHDIETKDALIEKQKHTIDKYRAVISCVEAFLGKEFLYL